MSPQGPKFLAELACGAKLYLRMSSTKGTWNRPDIVKGVANDIIGRVNDELNKIKGEIESETKAEMKDIRVVLE